MPLYSFLTCLAGTGRDGQSEERTMAKRTRIILLVAFTAGLVLLNYALSGSIRIPSGDVAIWFHGGLLMLIIGSYWIEHYFTRPADVVINGLVAFVSLSTLNSPPFPEWWSGLRIFSLLLSFAAFLLVWS